MISNKITRDMKDWTEKIALFTNLNNAARKNIRYTYNKMIDM